MGFVHYGKYRARRIKNLRIDEVSSVDRGAGEGVNVLLLKRLGFGDRGFIYERAPETTLEKVMENVSSVGVVKKLIGLVEKGECSDPIEFQKATEAAALAMFDREPNLGRALARFYDTAIGKEMLNAGVSLRTPAIQKQMREAGLTKRAQVDGADRFDKIVKASEEVPVRPFPTGSDTQRDPEPDDGDDNPHFPGLRARVHLAMTESQHRGKSFDQVVDYLSHHDPHFKETLQRAAHHEMRGRT
jgi:hypothetical protein